MKAKNYLLTFALITASVASTYFVTISTAQQGTQPAQTVPNNEYQLGATLYMQKAGEYRALAYQAFNMARWALDADLDKRNFRKLSKAEQKKPRAIMVDIDETMLDNSPAQALAIRDRTPFNLKDWYAWGEMRKAKAIPGAVDFAKYAKSLGTRVFFVSNRDEVQKRATIDNLRSVGFPDVSDENVLLKTDESSKEARRQIILQKYRIVMFIGDNLDDHSNVFEKKSVEDRFVEVDRAKDLFGKRYIMLPNAMYGTWENAIYDFGRLNEEQKTEKRLNALELP